MELYFYSSHIMSFSWSVYPCWTHLFERAKIMLWLVKTTLYASLKSFELGSCSSAPLICFWARRWLYFKEINSLASLILFWELENFKEICSHASLILFWELIFVKKYLCSRASLRSSWELRIVIVIYTRYEFGPKVIDIQGGYNKNFHIDHWI